MCSPLYYLTQPFLLSHYCFSYTTCVFLVTLLIGLPIYYPGVCSPVLAYIEGRTAEKLDPSQLRRRNFLTLCLESTAVDKLVCDWIEVISGIMDEDEMESEDWNLISSRKGQEKRESGRNEGSRVDSQTSKRGLEGNSSEEDNRVVRKKIVREEYKVILKFRKGR